jgi:ABC-type antimicrobial peptide transport system permease subunit
MGVRIALGASVLDILRLVFGQGLALAAAGVVLGMCGALGVARWLGALLFGVSAHDPLSFSLALVLLPGAALFGCWRPAWRAAGANPADTIRDQ